MKAPQQPTTSRELCAMALEAYHALFIRLPYQDPDAGFGQSYCSGTRWLEALEQADAWAVPREVIDAVERLISASTKREGDALADAVILFPHEFLMVIDRRRSTPSLRSGGRRSIDRTFLRLGAVPTPG